MKRRQRADDDTVTTVTTAATALFFSPSLTEKSFSIDVVERGTAGDGAFVERRSGWRRRLRRHEPESEGKALFGTAVHDGLLRCSGMEPCDVLYLTRQRSEARKGFVFWASDRGEVGYARKRS